MWLADATSDLITSNNGGGVWTFLAVIVMTAGTMYGAFRMTRGAASGRSPSSTPESTAPVAEAAAHQTLEEFRRDFYDPVKAERDKAIQERNAAQRAQAQAEREREACAAQREDLQERLTRALEQLSDERRRDD